MLQTAVYVWKMFYLRKGSHRKEAERSRLGEVREEYKNKEREWNWVKENEQSLIFSRLFIHRSNSLLNKNSKLILKCYFELRMSALKHLKQKVEFIIAMNPRQQSVRSTPAVRAYTLWSASGALLRSVGFHPHEALSSKPHSQNESHDDKGRSGTVSHTRYTDLTFTANTRFTNRTTHDFAPLIL